MLSVHETTGLDETLPFRATIVSTDTAKGYTEYTIAVQHRFDKSKAWKVFRRFSDFVALQSDLQQSGLRLPSLPKKLLGNMDPIFIERRKKELQGYLNALTSHHILLFARATQLFLNPDSPVFDCERQADSLASMCLRSFGGLKISQSWPSVGWRLRKRYLLTEANDRNFLKELVCWNFVVDKMNLCPEDLQLLLSFLCDLEHPYLCSPTFTKVTENGVLVSRLCYPDGSLKDYIYNTKPKKNYLAKYNQSSAERDRLALNEIRIFGRQILEALYFLHHKGHLHAGNIFIEDGICRLSDLENCFFGYRSLLSMYAMQCKAIKTGIDFDMYCFGHLMYEMCFTESLAHPWLSTDDPNLNDYDLFYPILVCLLSQPACTNGLPSPTDLIQHKFFRDIAPATAIPNVKISSRTKHLAQKCYSGFLNRFHEDQQLYFRCLATNKATKHVYSSEEKAKRKREFRKVLASSESDVRSELDKPSTASDILVVETEESNLPIPEREEDECEGSTPSPTCVKSEPVEESEDEEKRPLEKTGDSRCALLSSIRDFNKNSLKKSPVPSK